MMRGEYIGKHKELRGLTALLEWEGDILLAQFDGYPGKGPSRNLIHPITLATLCYGWHKFNILDFRIQRTWKQS